MKEKELLGRIYKALTGNPEGLNIVDIMNLCREYEKYYDVSSMPCEHLFSVRYGKCIKCGILKDPLYD
jgi:hypothetical protein